MGGWVGGGVSRDDRDGEVVRECTYLVDGHDVAEANAEVLPDDLVHLDLTLLHILVSENDTDRLLTFLTLQTRGTESGFVSRGPLRSILPNKVTHLENIRQI